MKKLCPTRFVVDSVESSNIRGGVAEVCAAPRLVYDSGLFFETCIRTYYVRPNISGGNKKHPPEVRSRDGHTWRTCV